MSATDLQQNEIDDNEEDLDNESDDVIQTYSYVFDEKHDGHPVHITSTNPRSQVQYGDNDDFIVSDGNQNHQVFFDGDYDFEFLHWSLI